MAKALNVSLAVTADTQQAAAALQKLKQQITQLQTTSTNFSIGGSWKQDVAEISKTMATLQATLKNATNLQTGNLDLTKFTQSMQQSNMSLEKYQQTLNAMGPAGQQAFASLANSIVQAEVPLRSANGLLSQFATTLANTARWQISSSILHGFMGTISSAFHYAQDLNESLNRIQIVTQQSDTQMAAFAKSANEAAKALSTTTTAYTDAALIYYQQGLSTKEVKERTDVTIKMANAAGVSAKTVSDQMTAVWNNFADGTKNLEYYADVMTALGAATASSTDEIATGLQKFASVADAVGLSYENAAAALATITATTRQSADSVGTGLRTLFARLQSLKLGETLEDGVDLTKYTKALQTVGVSALDATGSLRSMDDILADLGNKWENLSNTQKVALAQTVGGVRQYTTLMALMENNDFFQQNQQVALGSEGTVQKQADIYAGSWEAAQKRVKASAQTIFSDLINDDFFIQLNDGLSGFLDLVHQVIEGMGGLKGIFLAIGSVATTVFSKQVATGLQNMVNDIKMILPGGQQTILNQRQKAIDLLAKGQGNSIVGKEMATAYQEQSKLQGTYIDNAQRMSAFQRDIANSMMQQQQALIQNVELSAKEVQNAEEKATASRMDIGKFLNQKFEIGDSDISEAIRRIRRELTELQQSALDDGKIEHFIKKIADLGAENISVKDLNEQFNELQINAQKIGKFLGDKGLGQQLQEAIANASTNPQGLIKALSDIREAYFDNNIAEKGTVSLLEKIKKDFTENIPASEEEGKKFVKFLDDLIEKYQHLGSSQAKLPDTQNQLSKYTAELQKAMADLANGNYTAMDGFVSLAGTLTSLGYTYQRLINLGKTLNSTTIDGTQKLIAVLTTLGPVLTTIKGLTSVNTLKALTSIGLAFTQLGGRTAEGITASFTALSAGTATFGATLHAVLPELLIASAVIGALIGLGVLIYNASTKDAKALEQLKTASTNFENDLSNLKSTAADLKNEFSNYTEIYDQLQHCAKGSSEWRENMSELVETTETLLKDYPILEEYRKGLVADSNGNLVWTPDYINNTIMPGLQNKTNELQLLNGIASAGLYNKDIEELVAQNSDLMYNEDGAVTGYNVEQTLNFQSLRDLLSKYYEVSADEIDNIIAFITENIDDVEAINNYIDQIFPESQLNSIVEGLNKVSSEYIDENGELLLNSPEAQAARKKFLEDKYLELGAALIESLSTNYTDFVHYPNVSINSQQSKNLKDFISSYSPEGAIISQKQGELNKIYGRQIKDSIPEQLDLYEKALEQQSETKAKTTELQNNISDTMYNSMLSYLKDNISFQNLPENQKEETVRGINSVLWSAIEGQELKNYEVTSDNAFDYFKKYYGIIGHDNIDNIKTTSEGFKYEASNGQTYSVTTAQLKYEQIINGITASFGGLDNYINTELQKYLQFADTIPSIVKDAKMEIADKDIEAVSNALKSYYLTGGFDSTILKDLQVLQKYLSDNMLQALLESLKIPVDQFTEDASEALGEEFNKDYQYLKTEYGIDTSKFRLDQATVIKQKGEALSVGPTGTSVARRYFDVIETALEQVDEEQRSNLLDKILQADPTQIKEVFESFNIDTENLGVLNWDLFVKDLQKVQGILPSFTSLKTELQECAEIVQGLDFGSTIKDEDYNKLIAYKDIWAGFFQLQADGKYKVTASNKEIRQQLAQTLSEQQKSLENWADYQNKVFTNTTDKEYTNKGYQFTKDNISNLNELVQSSSELKEVLKLFGYSDTQLDKEITGEESYFDHLLKIVNSLSSGNYSDLAKELGSGILSLATNFEELNKFYKDYKDTTQGITSKEYQDYFDTMSKGNILAASSYTELTAAIEKNKKAAEEAKEDGIELTDTSNEEREKLLELTAGYNDLYKIRKQYLDSDTEANRKTLEFGLFMQETASGLSDMSTISETVQENLIQIIQAVSSTDGSQENVLTALTNTFKELGYEALSVGPDTVEWINNIIDSLGNGGLNQILTKLQSTIQALNDLDFGKTVNEDTYKDIIKKAPELEKYFLTQIDGTRKFIGTQKQLSAQNKVLLEDYQNQIKARQEAQKLLKEQETTQSWAAEILGLDSTNKNAILDAIGFSEDQITDISKGRASNKLAKNFRLAIESFSTQSFDDELKSAQEMTVSLLSTYKELNDYYKNKPFDDAYSKQWLNITKTNYQAAESLEELYLAQELAERKGLKSESIETQNQVAEEYATTLYKLASAYDFTTMQKQLFYEASFDEEGNFKKLNSEIADQLELLIALGDLSQGKSTSLLYQDIGMGLQNIIHGLDNIDYSNISQLQEVFDKEFGEGFIFVTPQIIDLLKQIEEQTPKSTQVLDELQSKLTEISSLISKLDFGDIISEEDFERIKKLIELLPDEQQAAYLSNFVSVIGGTKYLGSDEESIAIANAATDKTLGLSQKEITSKGYQQQLLNEYFQSPTGQYSIGLRGVATPETILQFLAQTNSDQERQDFMAAMGYPNNKRDLINSLLLPEGVDIKLLERANEFLNTYNLNPESYDLLSNGGSSAITAIKLLNYLTEVSERENGEQQIQDFLQTIGIDSTFEELQKNLNPQNWEEDNIPIIVQQVLNAVLELLNFDAEKAQKRHNEQSLGRFTTASGLRNYLDNGTSTEDNGLTITEEDGTQITYTAEQIETAYQGIAREAMTAAENIYQLDAGYMHSGEATDLYRENLVRVAGQYGNAKDELEIYNNLLEQHDEAIKNNETLRAAQIESQIASNEAMVREAAIIGHTAEVYEVNAEELEEYSEYLAETMPVFEGSAKAAASYAAGLMRAQDGIQKLNKVYKTYIKYLDRASDSLNADEQKEYRKAISDTTEAVKDLLGLQKNMDNLPKGFLQAAKASGALEKALEGDLEPLQKIYAAQTFAEKFSGGNLSPEELIGLPPEEALQTAIKNITGDLASMSDQISALFAGLPSLDPGQLLPEGAMQDAATAIMGSLINMGMSMDEVLSTMSAMGLEPELVESEGGEDSVHTSGEAKGVIAIPQGGGAWNYVDGNTVEYHDDQSADVKFYGVNFRKKGSPGGAGGGGGGGGGGKQKKKDHKKPDVATRYHTIKEHQADNSRAKEEASTNKERAFGAEKIKQAEKELELQKKNIDLQRKYIDEINSYLPGDKNEMVNSLIKLGITVEFDKDGVIENYRQIEEELLRQENDLIDQYNAGSLDDDAYNEAQKKIDDAREYIKIYEDTLNLYEEQMTELANMLNELSDLALDLTKTRVELKIDVDDDTLKLLEYRLSRIEDNAYKTAEAISLIGDKTDITLDKISNWTEGLTNLFNNHGLDINDINNWTDQQLIEAGFTQNEIDWVRELRDNLLDASQELNNVRQEIIDRISDDFSTLYDRVQHQQDFFDHYDSVLNTYKNITDLMGRSMNNAQRELIQNLNEGILQNKRNQMIAAKNVYENLLTDQAAIRERYEKAVAEGDEQAMLQWEALLNEMDDRVNEAHENWLSSWEESVQQAMDMFEYALEGAIQNFEEKMSGAFGSLDYLSEAFDRKQQTDEQYLQDYDRLYELSKLQRDLNKTLSDTKGLENRKALLALQREITELQANGTKLSQYDVDALRKKYELQQAYAELMDAQDAKHTVRLQRDNAGNWGYVYTVDEDAVAEAEQNYEDKLHEYQQLNDEYIKELQSRVLETQQTYRDTLQEIMSDTTLTDEQRQERLNELNQWLENEMSFFEQQLNNAMNNQHETLNRYYNAYGDTRAQLIDSWQETTLSVLTNISQLEDYMTNWQESTATLINDAMQAWLEAQNIINNINEDAGVEGDDIGTTIAGITTEIVSASEDTVAAISDMTNVLNDEFLLALQEAINYEDEWREKTEAAAEANEALAASLNDVIKRLTELESFDVGLTNARAKYQSAQHAWRNGTISEADWHKAEQEWQAYLDNWMAKFDEGGYTGNWGSSGKLAVLHEKENVFNANDTQNLLDAAKILRVIDLQSANGYGGIGNLLAPAISGLSQILEQQVTISAEFPNVTDHYEIEEAFNNLVNKAAQYANEKRNG